MAEINRYNNSKIYKICSNLTDKIYIGSTTQTLAQRLSKHVGQYKTHIKNNNTNYISSYEIIKYGDCYITLIEECNFNNQQQLFKREGEVIKLNINNVVNMFIAGRTKREYFIDNKEHITEQQKKYFIDNKEQVLEQQKQYRNDNKEQIKEYYNDNKERRKQYCNNNKEQIVEQKKQYYNDNKEKITERNKQYYNDKKRNKQYLNELNFFNI